jgi:hypothetical protein
LVRHASIRSRACSPCATGSDDPYISGQHNLIDYGYRAPPRNYYDRIVMDLTFLAGGMLGGSIFASDGNSDFRMVSQGALFSVIDANSDEPFGCGLQYPDCSGASGMLVAAARDVTEVPEPAPAPWSASG